MHLFLLCVSDAWALLLGLYGRYFYIVNRLCGLNFGIVGTALWRMGTCGMALAAWRFTDTDNHCLNKNVCVHALKVP